MATGADKELVDAKTGVPDLVFVSLTLCHSAGGREREGEGVEETAERTKQGQPAMLIRTSI